MSARRDAPSGIRRANEPGPSTDSNGSDVTTTERGLANDAQWKLIQKNTFTRWANEHLKTVDRHIADLETDLADGLRLIALIEVLAGKKFQKYNKRPAIRTQKLENITMALRFLQVEERIKIVNIDSSDIVDQQLKLILGLVWTLILHYSISMPTWDDDQATIQKKELTPKQRLLAWIQNKVPDRRIVNFTTDWNDGKAIGALVDGVAPGLCPDWEDWNVKDALPNATEAMGAAEKWLDVPQLIRPEEMCNVKVDELSMMTYLSQFPSAKLKTGAPLRPRTNPSRVRTYGPGLDSNGNSVGAPARFTVETFSAGKGDLDVTVFGPDGCQIPLESVFNNDQFLTHSCSYTPTMEGPFKVHVRFANREIPKSPFVVNVEGMAGDPTKVVASGSGLEKTGNVVKKKTGFDVFTKNAGTGVVDVVVVDPRGNSARPLVAKVTDDQWYVEYVPQVDGPHAIEIFFAGSHIPNSPFSVVVMPPLDATKCVATGRGIQPTGVRVGDKAQFQVETKDAGIGGHLAVKVTGPGGVEENVSVVASDQSLYQCCYVPRKPGHHAVSVTYGGQPIPRSPFGVPVLPQRKCRARAFGPGLAGGVVDCPACFTVETNGEPGTLGFSIEGPSQSKIECKDNEDGTAEISYMPKTAGEYAVHVLVNNEDINDSPFMAKILPNTGNFDSSKVKVSGSGIEPSGLIVGEPTEFIVDTRGAGNARLDVSLIDADCDVVDVSTTDNKDGTFACRYAPARAVRHTAFVAFGGLSVPGSPFRMLVKERSDPGKVKVSGPAFSNNVVTFQPTYFVVDCSEAGPGDIDITLADNRNNDVAIKTTDHKDNTFTVQFEPDIVGQYVARIYFAGNEIPGSPRKISVLPSIDLSGVKVIGMDENVFTESPIDFSVDLGSVPGDHAGKLKAIITAPSGDKMEAVVIDRPDGSSSCLFSLMEEGFHSVDVSYGGLPIPASPFRINAVSGCDPSMVKVHGPGLNGGFTFQPQTFVVDTKKAGKGGLGLAIEGPSEAKMTCRDNRDGTCDVEYLPVKRGVYDIAVKFAEQNIPGSPFQVCIKDELNPSRVRCFGPGLDQKQVRLGQVVKFTVDASEAGEASLDVAVTDCNGLRQEPCVAATTEGVYEVNFDPKSKGQQRVDVLYGAKPVPESPFFVDVLPKFEPNKVTVFGDGIRGPVLATVPTSFTVSTSDAGEADLQVLIKDPSGKEISNRVTRENTDSHKVSYTADTVGRHSIWLTYGGEPVSAAPFTVDVTPAGDVNSVKIIGDVPSVVPVGKECTVSVDRSSAGVGRVRCRVTGGDDDDVKVEVKDGGDGGVDEISYVLPQRGSYDVQVEFGGRQVPEGFFTQEAVDVDEYDGYVREQELKLTASSLANGVYMNGVDGVDSASVVYNPVDFTIAVGPVFGFVKAEVTTPSGKTDFPKVIDNRNSTITVRYEPTEVGTHRLDISYNDCPVDGSPFQFSVDAVRAGNVTAYGGGLTQGIVGRKCSFVVDTANLDSNGLVILVEGPSKTDIHVEDNSDRTCTVSYTPLSPGDYQIFIKYASHDIAGSPFTARIIPSSDDDHQMVTLAIGSNRSEISLMVVEPDVDSLKSTVKSPSGKETPCALRCLINGQLGISFSAKEVGTHFVSVLRDGSHIKNSPFRISIIENQLCRVDRVRAFGKGLTEGRTNELSEFFVNCKDAGFGNLSLSIEGPGKATVNCQENDAGLCHVRYKPLLSGIYAVNIKFADEDINGSPFLVQVKDQASGQRAELDDTRNQSEITHIGCDCELRLIIRDVLLKDLEASVVNPSSVSAVCRVSELDSGLFAIVFVPEETGVHHVTVRHHDKEIPGSPFRFTIGPVMEGGADRVQVMGMGMQGGKAGLPGHFGIYTKEAGAGNLSVVMEGPSKAVLDVKDQLDGSCDVSYVAGRPGDYLLSIKFNGVHVPNSPFRVPIVSSGDVNSNIPLGDETIQVNKPTSVFFNMKGDVGRLEAFVVDPSGSKEQAFIQQLNNGRYAVRFVPYYNGFHSVHVTRNGIAVFGSPFRLVVGKQEPNPSLVQARGDGLANGFSGRPAKFFVNTLDAGPGPLAVCIDGPSKVEVLCDEVDEGFEITYTPHAPGLYQIGVTYGGESRHIPNSPFMALVEGSGRPVAWNERSQLVVESQSKNKKSQSDDHLTNGFGDHEYGGAAMVSSQGPGLHKGLVDRTAMFTVDTSRAGQGILLVGVVGPSGPSEEVMIKHLGCGHYAVSYQPKEHGNYLVVIRWGDQHIPGSPFEVLVQ